MKHILGGGIQDLNDFSVELPEGLVAELKSIEFVELGDLVVVKGDHQPTVEHVLDPTGTECLTNHWHIDDLIPTSEYSESEMARLGIRFARELQNKLQGTLIPGQFRVIVSVTHLLDDPLQQTCTIRCHKLRLTNPWLSEDLEGYRSEAILVLDWII
jgi:hypothetical protein